MLLFLDFDGVLHGYGEPRFKHRPVLEATLREHPRVEVVFSTSWREHQGIDRLRSFFSEDVRHRFIGATPRLDVNKEPPYVDFVRHKEILFWLEHKGIIGRGWLALDDDYREFQPDCKELLVCNPKFGLGQSEIAVELRRRLTAASIVGGRP